MKHEAAGVATPACRSRIRILKVKVSVWGFLSTHRGGIDSLRVVVDHPGQAEVRHFTDEVAVDKDVACREVAMHIAHV